MTGIKRYDVDGRFEESSEGDFVRFEDIIIYLSEQDYQYNKQTNELIARHAEQLEVAAEFCRQYQIENKQLKADAEADNETNLQLNLEIMTLKAENKKLGDYYMKINDVYWNDEIFEVNHGEGFYTDKFVEMVVDL